MNKSDAATPGFTNPSTNQIDRTKTNELYDLWPKTNGDMHIEMFRKMKAGTITAAVVWGQNPAITEPNQSFIRDGLENLETLVVVDMFENETAACKRKTAGVTYLIPAASHVEKAGSAANSGRVLQWRERATKPKGNSKSDMELLFRFAHALNGASAFTHITDKWTSIGKTGLNAYTVLYGDRYGWTPGGATAFDDVSGTADIWRGAGAAPSSGLVYGQEWIAEQMFREMCTGTTGTSWLYTGAYSTDKTTNKHTGQADWLVDNRAKSRATADPNGTLAYPGWGYSWLVNRRVLYNNSQVPGDVADFYMGPDSCARLYVTTETRNGVDLNYSRWYRFYHRLSDVPDVAGVHVLPGRFPGHTEPYETPASAATLASFGRNTKGGGQWDLVPTDSAIFGKNRTLKAGAPAPLVLTTIRCVEHFQGGPITRNNPYNHEAEPEPWIELNSVDAVRFGIKDGDWVNVVTARSNSTTQQEGRSNQAAGWAKGFKARVGVGPTSNQRVGPGVAAIPWHWGEMGLSKGSRANDLCVDAFDANTRIPESKACLCWVTKTVSATPATFVDGGV
jgi:formate dehydrogenase major subunit